jgi:hypothetical protein
MPEYTGKNLYVSFAGTVVSSRFRSFDNDETMAMVDKSAGADGAMTYLNTLEDGKATLEVLDLEQGTALWAALVKGAAGTLIWGDEGSAAGKPKHTVPALVARRRKTTVYNEVVKGNFDFQYNGTVVDGTFP